MSKTNTSMVDELAHHLGVYSMQHVHDRINQALKEEEDGFEAHADDPESCIGFALSRGTKKYSTTARVLVEMFEDRKQFFEAEQAYILRQYAGVCELRDAYAAKLDEHNRVLNQKARSKE